MNILAYIPTYATLATMPYNFNPIVHSFVLSRNGYMQYVDTLQNSLLLVFTSESLLL